MKTPPGLSQRKAAARAARDERLAQALRDNLRRRKEQARAKDPDGKGEPAALSDAPLSSKSNPCGGASAK